MREQRRARSGDEAIIPQQRELEHVRDPDVGAADREVPTAIVRMGVNTGEVASELPEERRDDPAKGRRVEHRAETVHLEDNHSEARERLVVGGENVPVLGTLDVHLEQ